MDYILQYLPGIVASVFSGVVLWQIKENREESLKYRKERQRMEVGERNMLLGVADLTILIGKKLNDSDSVNGELGEGIKSLQEKKQAVQDLTNEQYFAYREEGRHG